MSETSQQVWLRLPEEDERVYARFRAYLETDPIQRTFIGTAETLKCHVKTIERLAKKYRWKERALAYDNDIKKKELAITEMERLEAMRKHLTIARAVQAKAAKRIAEMRPEDMTVEQCVRFFESMARIEREVLGEHDPNAGEAININIFTAQEQK